MIHLRSPWIAAAALALGAGPLSAASLPSLADAPENLLRSLPAPAELPALASEATPAAAKTSFEDAGGGDGKKKNKKSKSKNKDKKKKKGKSKDKKKNKKGGRKAQGRQQGGTDPVQEEGPVVDLQPQETDGLQELGGSEAEDDEQASPGEEADDEQASSGEDSGEDDDGAQEAGDGPELRALARGGDRFVLDALHLQAAPGARLVGMTATGNVESQVETFGSLPVDGGLFRVGLRLSEPWTLELAGPEAAAAREQGLRIWLVAMGTPDTLSTWDGVTLEAPADLGLSPDGRSIPSSADAWAAALVARIQEMESRYGVLPDYVEIWNEPDRAEFFAGDFEDWLEIYRAAAPALKEAFPELRVGGMGLAGADSAMGGEESALLQLADRAAEEGLPLDFLSWHNYTIAAEMRYTRVGERLRERLDARGLEAELVVSEWNIYPSPQGHGLEFDGSHAAANFAGLVSVVADHGLDGQLFFMLYDVDDQAGIADLLGHGMGALTRRGLRKPVFRTMEFLYEMAGEPWVPVTRPENEYAVAVLATRSGDRLRIVVANDTVDPDWIWANGVREYGLQPGILADRLLDIDWLEDGEVLPATELEAAGLSAEEAQASADVLDRVLDAWEAQEEGRDLELEILGAEGARVTRVWRFDEERNAPATHRDELLPWLEQVEEEAQAAAEAETLSFLESRGVAVPEEAELESRDASGLAEALGISESLAAEACSLYARSLAEARAAQGDWLNSLPGAALEEESAEEAGVEWDGERLRLHLDRDSLMVLELELGSQ